MSKEKRKIEVRRNGFWVEVLMKDVKAGDTIRMFEPSDNEPVKDINGDTEFYAVADATLQSEGVYGCQVDIQDERK